MLVNEKKDVYMKPGLILKCCLIHYPALLLSYYDMSRLVSLLLAQLKSKLKH